MASLSFLILEGLGTTPELSLCSVRLDRSRSLFNFVPQENILTVKLVRLATSFSFEK